MAELELWGCVCGEKGRRAAPKKIDQLEKWPTPRNCQQLNSFLCFVNYLREYMDPKWIKYETMLSPFRKKGMDFDALWSSDAKYEEAFNEIRLCLSRDVVLLHPDYNAAARPDQTGRPFEIFVDANDYGWAAVLCQRPAPHVAPRIIAIISRAFNDTQLSGSCTPCGKELLALRG